MRACGRAPLGAGLPAIGNADQRRSSTAWSTADSCLALATAHRGSAPAAQKLLVFVGTAPGGSWVRGAGCL